MSLSTLISNFCLNTIEDHESRVYEVFSEQNKLVILNNEQFAEFIKDATNHYLNAVYAALIRKDNQYVVESFEQMCNDHSPICILNIILLVIKSVHLNLNRYRLNISSHDSYIKSLFDQINPKKEFVIKLITSSLSHQCKVIDINSYDPDKSIF